MWKQITKIARYYHLILSFGIIVYLFLLSRRYFLGFFYPYYFGQESLFIIDLFGFYLLLPIWVILIFSLLNLILLMAISKEILDGKSAILIGFLYLSSPWIIYSDSFGSIYVFFLFLVLVIVNGFIYMRSTDKSRFKIGLITSLVSMIVFSLTSLLGWFMILVWSIFLVSYVKFPSKQFKFFTCLILIIFQLILSLIIIKNLSSFNNIFNKQITIFSDPGLINTVNLFQGETREAGFDSVTRIIENKYQYYFRNIIFITGKHFVPATYFTSQENLVGFSFNPPIFFGWIIPFFFGLYLFLKKDSNKIFFLFVLILILPSILTQMSPVLLKLILVSPIFFLVISYGFFNLWQRRKRIVPAIALICTIFLILIQTGITIYDTATREPIRLEKYLDQRSINIPYK